ncbi:MAG: 4Fe-4S dicluster domain-containing protein [Chloroflexi bacterium]|nr:4Fe-4S dicluster domain-containing protein [Chloroflexota bacterium]
MCLPTCPTYRELGQEMDSPRGRIALIKAVADGRLSLDDPDFTLHMDRCLVCRNCETVCPAGVNFSHLMEDTRSQITRSAGNGRSIQERLLRFVILGQIFPYPARLRLLGGILRLYQRSGLQALVRWSGILQRLPGHLDSAEALLPQLSKDFFLPQPEEMPPPPVYPIRRVALFSGCIQSLIFADVNRATARVLAHNGCQVMAPPLQVCCGALHSHSGETDLARDLARKNLDAFAAAAVDAIIINAAGCGAMLKEYNHLLHDDPVYAARAEEFAAKVKDINEFLADLPLVPPQGRLEWTVTYQDACHLAHAQHIREAPRQVLRSIPGLELIEMVEADYCCGSAGIYNLVQPELSQEILQRKLGHVIDTHAQVVASPNPGCALQIQSGLRQKGLSMRVMHPVEILDRAYRQPAAN